MFELTGAFTHVLPLMAVIMVSRWCADAFGKDGVFDAIINAAGYPYLDQKRTLLRHAITARDIMVRSETLIQSYNYNPEELRYKIAELLSLFPAFDGNIIICNYKGGFPIVDESGLLIGYIAQSDLTYCTNDSTTSINFQPSLENAFTKWVDYAPLSGILILIVKYPPTCLEMKY
jgi:chloride channel 3/4/5